MAPVRQVNLRGSTWQSSTSSTLDTCLCHRSTCWVRSRAWGGYYPCETHYIIFLLFTISVDPLEALGRSIDSAILERLDVYSLIRAGQVCRYSVSIPWRIALGLAHRFFTVCRTMCVLVQQCVEGIESAGPLMGE